MSVVAFSGGIWHILDHIGVDSQEDCDALDDDGLLSEPDWDLAAQPALDYEGDLRIN